jgi:hypothetical protein
MGMGLGSVGHRRPRGRPVPRLIILPAPGRSLGRCDGGVNVGDELEQRAPRVLQHANGVRLDCPRRPGLIVHRFHCSVTVLSGSPSRRSWSPPWDQQRPKPRSVRTGTRQGYPRFVGSPQSASGPITWSQSRQTRRPTGPPSRRAELKLATSCPACGSLPPGTPVSPTGKGSPGNPMAATRTGPRDVATGRCTLKTGDPLGRHHRQRDRPRPASAAPRRGSRGGSDRPPPGASS